ncbi:hypothetical protein ACOME3_008110 [Neoechinorhynchus agilis]
MVSTLRRPHLNSMRLMRFTMPNQALRIRTIFTTEQRESLEEYFQGHSNPPKEQIERIAMKLEMNDGSVKRWFDRKRLQKRAEKNPESFPCLIPNIREMLNRKDLPHNANPCSYLPMRPKDWGKVETGELYEQYKPK